MAGPTYQETCDRVAYAARLYASGYADKVILSGGGWGMDRQALSSGIPQNAILIEAQSMTTFENAKYSYKIGHDQGFKSAIVVTSPFHTKRSSIIFTRVCKGIDLTICSVPYDPVIAQKWWHDSYATQFVISEYLKLAWHYLLEWK